MRYPYSLHSNDRLDTLGILEATSIARGYAAADAMLKRAPIRMVDVTPASPGKLLILFTGDVASMQDAMDAGVVAVGPSLWGRSLLFNLSPQVVPAINRKPGRSSGDSVGIVETFGAASAVEAADAAAKSTEIALQSITLLNGLGGKAFVLLTGNIADVEAAINAARRSRPEEEFADTVVIPRFHGDLEPYLPGMERGIGGGSVPR